MPAGNSGTPPAKKLGNTEGLALSAPGLPASVRAEIETVACLRYLARPGKAPPGGAAVPYERVRRREGS